MTRFLSVELGFGVRQLHIFLIYDTADVKNNMVFLHIIYNHCTNTSYSKLIVFVTSMVPSVESNFNSFTSLK